MFGDKNLKEVETISLSNNTVARRIDEMSRWLKVQLIIRVKAISNYFSLQLDESTEIYIYIYIHVIYIYNNNESHEDLLFCKQIIRGTSNDIFETLNTYLKMKGLDLINCVGIWTGGTGTMCSKNSGILTQTQMLKLNPNTLYGLINENYILKLSYLEDIFSKLTELNLNLQMKLIYLLCIIKLKPL